MYFITREPDLQEDPNEVLLGVNQKIRTLIGEINDSDRNSSFST